MSTSDKNRISQNGFIERGVGAAIWSTMHYHNCDSLLLRGYCETTIYQQHPLPQNNALRQGSNNYRLGLNMPEECWPYCYALCPTPLCACSQYLVCPRGGELEGWGLDEGALAGIPEPRQ